MIDLVDMIFFHAAANPEKPAVITSDGTLTYGTLRRGILSVQVQLSKNGLKAGDRIGIHVQNPIGHMTLICALHRAGMISISLDKPQSDFLNENSIDALLTNAPVAGTSTRMIPVDDSWFSGEPPHEIGPNLAQATEPNSLCRLIMSSGTTGRPKLIGLSWEAVRQRLISYSIRTSTPSWDRIVCTPGLSTNYGYSFAVTTLWLGRTICFAYDATARLLILTYRAELLVTSTHQIAEIVKGQEGDFRRLDSLRAVHIGGSVAYAPLLARIRMLVCNLVYCGYGSTEGGTVAYAPSEMIFGMDRAVGLMAPWIETEVIDKERNVLDYGNDGEIRIRAIGQGYRYSKDERGHYAVDDSEWFYPGDQGIVFRNGLMVITGRTNELINRGGTKVSPESIEEIFRTNSIIEDVGVVGMIDAMGIEQVWVAVVSATEIEIDRMFDYVREKSPFYTPDRIFQVKEIPRNRLGKIAREELKSSLKLLEENHALTVR